MKRLLEGDTNPKSTKAATLDDDKAALVPSSSPSPGKVAATSARVPVVPVKPLGQHTHKGCETTSEWCAPTDGRAAALPILRSLVPQVRSSSFKWLSSHEPELLQVASGNAEAMEMINPLKITAVSGEGGVSGMKEVWDLGNMKRSLSTHKVYEAGATLWVLDAKPHDIDDSWDNLVQLGEEALDSVRCVFGRVTK